MLIWNIRMENTRTRRFKESSDTYDCTDLDFYERFCIYKEDVNYLVNEFCYGLETETRRNQPVPLDHKMLFEGTKVKFTRPRPSSGQPQVYLQLVLRLVLCLAWEKCLLNSILLVLGHPT